MTTSHITNNFNLYQQFKNKFSQYSDKNLLTTYSGNTYSYAEVDEESSRLAGFMSDLGLAAGDRVSVQVEKSPEALCLYFACLRAGFVFHPLNTGYQADELSYFISNAAPALIVCAADNKDLMSTLAKEHQVNNVLTLEGDGSGSLMSQSRHRAADFSIVMSQANDLAALLYSSGTTGVPKGIMLSHNNLLSSALSLTDAWGFTEQDVLLHALPIFHVHGLFVALGCVMLSGASMQWLPSFDIKKALELLPQCTVLMGVPTYYTRLLASDDFNTHLASSIRLFVSGSAPLLSETFINFEQRCGHRILERYGMTETNMNTSNPLHGERKAGTVGLPLLGVEVRICDDNNTVLAQGEVGNLQVKGNNVFSGYWKLPEKTAEDFTDDGFFNTGDKGLIDEQGYVSIVGRAKDMVITGGLNVYPKEVELLVDDLDGVQESAIIGISHPDFGEAVVAVIVTEQGATLDEAGIIGQVKSKLANFKVPKRVLFVDELPRNTMGKVQKNLLREANSALFAAS